jgi:hypothetical protein
VKSRWLRSGDTHLRSTDDPDHVNIFGPSSIDTSLLIFLKRLSLHLRSCAMHLARVDGLDVMARFSSSLLSFTKGLFPFTYADLSSLLMNPEPKIHIFPHICSLSVMQDAYTLVAPLQLVYIRICARKYKNEVGFPCHDRRSMIFGLPYTRNILTRPFNCILEAIRA